MNATCHYVLIIRTAIAYFIWRWNPMPISQTSIPPPPFSMFGLLVEYIQYVHTSFSLTLHATMQHSAMINDTLLPLMISHFHLWPIIWHSQLCASGNLNMPVKWKQVPWEAPLYSVTIKCVAYAGRHNFHKNLYIKSGYKYTTSLHKVSHWL